MCIEITAKKPISFNSVRKKIVEAKALTEINPKNSIAKAKNINDTNLYKYLTSYLFL